MKQLAGFALILACVGSLALEVTEQPEIFRDADLELGERLLSENRCAACHAQKVGGDGSAIYRPLERVNGPGVLRGTVEQCNLNLNLSLFPDEVTAISAVLNRDHYQFK